MAVYDGVPSIRLEGNEERALALIPEAKVVLQQVQAFIERSGVPTFSMSRRVSDDEYIYVLCTGGQNIIHISAGVGVPDIVEPELVIPEPTHFPDFYSGVVTNGNIVEKTKVVNGETVTFKVIESFAPTATCQFISRLQPGAQPVSRLVVEPREEFSEWTYQGQGDFKYSQYVVPRSSQWSGLMQKVVQVVMGLGRIKKNRMADPDKVVLGAEDVTAYMRSVEASGVQIRYDYKFARTHGITRASDGRLWLVEVSLSRGVVAMPLPIFPKSDTDGYLIRALSRGDLAMVTALEELGCLPNGNGFPVGAAYTDGVANGDILILCPPSDLSEFYFGSGFSSACGWAFSPTGNEAHNVGYYYPEDSVYQRSVWYQVNIQIGPIRTNRQPGQPIAAAAAQVVKQNEGFLYSPPSRLSYIPVKYHEPLIGGLLSHSARPTGPGDPINCDSPVFVAFINGELKLGKYFQDNTTKTDTVITDDRFPGECLYDGEWTWTSTSGTSALPAMPYTNDHDSRAVLEDVFETTTLTSANLGFNPPVFADFIESPEACHVTRSKAYRNTVVNEKRGGERRGAVLVVPDLCREAYYYYEGHSYNGGRSGSTTVSYSNLGDPNAGYGWRKAPRINFPPWPDGWGCGTEVCGGKHTERRVVCLVYEPTGCSDFADSGPWMTECQNIEALCSAAQPIRTGYQTTWNKGTDFQGSLTLWITGLNGPQQLTCTEAQYTYANIPSPDPDTDLIQIMRATASAIGEPCARFQTGMSGAYTVKQVGITPIEVSGMPTFVGVNNNG